MAGAARPEAVFVDTGAFFAAVNERDAHHGHAVGVFQAASRTGVPLVTTKWTVVETHALFVARASPRTALRWLEAVPADVLPVSAEEEAAALRILRSHRDKGFTLVDTASFALMERLGIRYFHSYDRHFRQYGRFVPVDPTTFGTAVGDR